VTEDYVLRNWAIETINRKLRNGVSFDLLRRGFGIPDEDYLEPLTAAEESNLYGVYL
jgi:hypothetical protein